MNKKQTLITGMVVLLLFITIYSASAWGPNVHVDWSEEVLQETNWTTLTKELVIANEDAFMCGLMYPDTAVIYYYSSFKTYKGLHDWNTANKLWEAATTDRQRAFAIGWSTHCAMDMVSHNYYVPDKIRATKLINTIIHPVYELETDSHYMNVKSAHAFEIHAEFDEWVTSVTGIDMSEEAELLNQAVGGNKFYDESYTLPEHGWLYKMYNFIAKAVRPFVKEAVYHPYMDRTKEEVRNVLRNNAATLDPSGESALTQASEESEIWQWAIGIGLIVLAYWLAHKRGWL